MVKVVVVVVVTLKYRTVNKISSSSSCSNIQVNKVIITEVSAVFFSVSSTASSARISEKSHDLQLMRMPMRSTHLAKNILSFTIFAISGKCQPCMDEQKKLYKLLNEYWY